MQHGAFAWSPATHSNIDVGSSYPTIRTILDVAAWNVMEPWQLGA